MTCEGKVAVVTGAAGKGMGRSIALTLAREGASVVVNFRSSKEQAEAIVAGIAETGGKALAVQADVFEAAGCKKLIDAAVKEFKRVDICIINPGAGWHMEPPSKVDAAAALEDAAHELAPIYHLLPLVLPGMYKRKWGRVIALGLAVTPPYGSPSYAYNVGKAARAYAMRLAVPEAWHSRVTLNVIDPPVVPEIATLAEAVEQAAHGPAWRKRDSTAPQDIAEGVAFLCSEAGRFISGCEMKYVWRGGL